MEPAKLLLAVTIALALSLASGPPGTAPPPADRNLRLPLGAPGGGVLASPLPPPSPQTVFPPDNRTRVTPTTSYPWRAIAKLYIYTNGDNLPDFECTGFLVSPIHAMTAGHCVNDRDFDATNGYWARRIRVVPAAEERTTPLGAEEVEPYGSAWAKTMRVLPGWLAGWAYQEDLALLTLDGDLGNRTGWFPLKSDLPSSALYVGPLETAGYPGDRDGAMNLYAAAGRGCRASEDNHWFSLDTYQGQSGSPVFADVAGTPSVLSVVTYGSTGCNIGTRLSEAKVGTLLRWMAADAGGRPPIAYIDLLAPGSTARFAPAAVVPGRSRLDITLRVENNGTAPSPAFTIAFYASLDPTVDGGDELLGSQPVGPLGPFASATVSWSGVVPSNLSEGRYWVGWLVDVGGAVNELDEANNRGHAATGQLAVAPGAKGGAPEAALAVGLSVLLAAASLLILVALLRWGRRPPVRHPPWIPQPGLSALGPLPPPWRYCGHCGTPFMPDMRFCVNCGAWLAPATPPGPP